MLRISQTKPGDHAVTLRLEGRVVGPWVTELQRLSEEVLAKGRTLGLHLGEVEFLDVQGVALLSKLRARGVTLLECPPFAAEQLRETPGP